MTPRSPRGTGKVRNVPWSYLVRNEWDQIAQAVLSIGFGVWGLIGVTRLPSIEALGALIIIFDVEFILVGLLLLLGLRTNSWALRRRAFIVYSAALGMFALLLLFISRTPFSLLALAFCFQGVVTVRLLARQERLALAVLDDRAQEKGHRP